MSYEAANPSFGLNKATGHTAYASASQAGGQHSYSGEEVRAFASYINEHLKGDPDCAHLLPLSTTDHAAFFGALRDGVIICKLLNVVKPGLINPKHISKSSSVHHITQNLTTAIRACKEIGIQTVNISAEDFLNGTRHLMLGLVWQIVRQSLVKNINLQAHPEMITLMEKGEDYQKFLNLTPENTLLRWFNQQLQSGGHPRKVTNFTTDIQDGENYLALLHQIAPSIVPREVLAEKNPVQRAQLVCDYAQKMGIDPFVTPKDINDGNRNLNMAFVADIFNKYPAIAVQQQYDNMQAHALEQAELANKLKLEEEERLRRARWSEEESQRAAVWAQQDEERRNQLAKEDRDRWEAEQARKRQLEEDHNKLLGEQQRLEEERRRLSEMRIHEDLERAKQHQLAQEELAKKQKELNERLELEQRRQQEDRRRQEEQLRRMEDERRSQEENTRRNEENSRRQLEEDRRRLEEEKRDWVTRTTTPGGGNSLVLPAPPATAAAPPAPYDPFATAVPVPTVDPYAPPVPYNSSGFEHTHTVNPYAAAAPYGAPGYVDPMYMATAAYTQTGYPYGVPGHQVTTTNMYGAAPGSNSATTINITGKIKKKAMKNLTKNLPAITAQAQQPGYGQPQPMYPGAPAPYGQPGYYPPPAY